MDTYCDSALSALEAEFQVNLNMEVMFPHLETDAGGFLTHWERISLEDTYKNRGLQKAFSELINELRRKGTDAFNKFCSILVKTGQEVWSGRLYDKAEEMKKSSSKLSM
jgi:hypothetical protein